MEIKSLDEKILFLQIDNIINLDEDIENYQDKIIPFSAFYQDKYHDSIEDQYSS